MLCANFVVKLLSFRTFAIIAISYGLTCGNFMGGVTASSHKYPHGQLATKLSGGMSHDYGSKGSSLSVGNNVGGGGVGSNNSNGVKNTNGATANKALDSNVGVGEVFVPKTFSLSSQEPTCEQLRAMWIFSKRQSRAAEMSNEIPTYRDPFTYNVWEPYYPSTRSRGALRMSPRERSHSPVYGRIVSREPLIPQRTTYGQRQRHFAGGFNDNNGASGRFYGAETKPTVILRRPSQNRLLGGGNGSSANIAGNGGGINQNSIAVQGSFQKLKELIWTERAKELTQQRRAEEIAARAAVLKEIANGQNIQTPYKQNAMFNSDSLLMDENRSPDGDGHQYMSDSRTSFADAQKKPTKPNFGNSATTRSYAGRTKPHSVTNRLLQKGSIFSGNTPGGGQPGRLSLRLASNGVTMSNEHQQQDISSVLGIPKTYPLRQSHFRERNRSLFKQNSPTDSFQREIRNWNQVEPAPKKYTLEDILKYFEPYENDLESDAYIGTDADANIDVEYDESLAKWNELHNSQKQQQQPEGSEFVSENQYDY